MTERAGIWLRVSSTGQDEENQRPDLDAWCERQGYDVKAEYVLHGKSARKGSRKFDQTWAQVVSDLLTGKITVLVVWRLSRIDRKLAATRMIAEVVESGGRVEFTQQPHLNDLSTMAGRIALKVEEELAFMESEEKSDRVKASHNRIRANGATLGRAPFGYVTAGEVKFDKRIVPTEEGRCYIPQIFGRVADGESLESVCAWLRSETGASWWPRSLWLIIRNAAYCGRRANSAGVTVGRCEAIIDADLWQRANRALVSKPGRRGPVKGQTALLTSVLFCGDCADAGADSPMYRISGGKGRRWNYYRCSGKGSSRKSCGLMVRLEETDATVTEWLSMMQAPRMISRRIEGSSHFAELAEVELDLAELPKLGLADAAEDAERSRLRSERNRLNALPEQAARTVMEPSGQTVGEHFSSLDDAGRRAMLLADGIKVYARRTRDAVPAVDGVPVTSKPIATAPPLAIEWGDPA